jgi:hypothetical protein
MSPSSVTGTVVTGIAGDSAVYPGNDVRGVREPGGKESQRHGRCGRGINDGPALAASSAGLAEEQDRAGLAAGDGQVPSCRA